MRQEGTEVPDWGLEAPAEVRPALCPCSEQGRTCPGPQGCELSEALVVVTWPGRYMLPTGCAGRVPSAAGHRGHPMSRADRSQALTALTFHVGRREDRTEQWELPWVKTGCRTGAGLGEQ